MSINTYSQHDISCDWCDSLFVSGQCTLRTRDVTDSSCAGIECSNLNSCCVLALLRLQRIFWTKSQVTELFVLFVRKGGAN